MIALTLAVDNQNKESATDRFMSEEVLQKDLNLVQEALTLAIKS